MFLSYVASREEQEKLNVWVALLNLENMYGTEESLKKVFERALQFCEPMPVYQQLADIYTKSEKMKVRPANLMSLVVGCALLGLVYWVLQPLMAADVLVILIIILAGGREPV